MHVWIKGGCKPHARCWTRAPSHLSIPKQKSVSHRKGYLSVHETLLVQLQEKNKIPGKVIPPDRSLSRSHAVFFFKCVFSFDVHILHLLILMRALRKSWEQRETSAPRGMCSLLAKAVTAIVWAAWATVQSLLKRRWSIHTLSLEHCHSEVWLIYILIRASEKASKSLQCTI